MRHAILGSGLLLSALSGGCAPSGEIPYPPSELVSGIEWDWDARVERAPGSDNWALTWGAGDVQWAAWGDGGGFGGTNREHRASLGVARIEGEHPDFVATNVFGGADAEAPATFEGKSYGILALDGELWMWVSPGSGTASYAKARLARSRDGGHTWEHAEWAFGDGLVMPAFLQFGPDGADFRDGHAYVYFPREKGRLHRALGVFRPGEVDLARAPKESLFRRDAWEFFAGLGEGGVPRWTPDEGRREPVFRDPRGVGWCLSVSWQRSLRRYVLCTEHDETFGGHLGFFAGEEPWGPWRTIEYASDWGPADLPRKWFYGNFANRWGRDDQFVFVATGVEACDRWVSIPGRFVRGTGPAGTTGSEP